MSKFSNRSTILAAEQNPINKRILEHLMDEDPALMSFDTINALRYLSQHQQITFLDFPKLKIFGELKLFMNIKNKENERGRYLDELRIYINAISRLNDIQNDININASTLISLILNLIGVTIELTKTTYGYKEINVTYNKSFEKDLNNSYVTTDQIAILNLQKNLLKEAQSNRIFPDTRYEEIEPIGFINIGTQLVNSQLNLQYTMKDVADDQGLKQISFLNLPLETKNNAKRKYEEL